jgi:hypothetical protein
MTSPAMHAMLWSRGALSVNFSACARGFHTTPSVGKEQARDRLESLRLNYEQSFLQKVSRLRYSSPLFNSFRWRQECKRKALGFEGSTRLTFALKPDVPQVCSSKLIPLGEELSLLEQSHYF